MAVRPDRYAVARATAEEERLHRPGHRVCLQSGAAARIRHRVVGRRTARGIHATAELCEKSPMPRAIVATHYNQATAGGWNPIVCPWCALMAMSCCHGLYLNPMRVEKAREPLHEMLVVTNAQGCWGAWPAVLARMVRVVPLRLKAGATSADYVHDQALANADRGVPESVRMLWGVRQRRAG